MNDETKNVTNIDVTLGNEAGETHNKKFLTFNLAEEQYGMPLSSVKEIIGITAITPVPQVPKFFKGLINLRGKIISVIDLRIKLRLEATEFVPKKTSIVITEIDDMVIGIIVDYVDAVIGFSDKQIDVSSDIQSKVNHEYVTGIAKTEDSKLCIILDISKVLSMDELNMLRRK